MEKGPTFRTLNQELAWGRFPPLSQLYPLLAFEKNMIKTFKKTKQKFTALFPFFMMRGKNVLTPF